MSDYVPVIDASGSNYAYLNIPYFTSESNLKNEIYQTSFVTIINLNAFIFLIAGIVALFITNRITNSFSVISDKMKQINLGKRMNTSKWQRDDELGALVVEYKIRWFQSWMKVLWLLPKQSVKAWERCPPGCTWDQNCWHRWNWVCSSCRNQLEKQCSQWNNLRKVLPAPIEQTDQFWTRSPGVQPVCEYWKSEKGKYSDINEAIMTIIHLYQGERQAWNNTPAVPQKIMIEADKTHINRLFTKSYPECTQGRSGTYEGKDWYQRDMLRECVAVSISDNGMGINEDIRSKIFVPNFTFVWNRLGLAMCKRMVEQAKGEIWFDTNAAGKYFSLCSCRLWGKGFGNLRCENVKVWKWQDGIGEWISGLWIFQPKLNGILFTNLAIGFFRCWFLISTSLIRLFSTSSFGYIFLKIWGWNYSGSFLWLAWPFGLLAHHFIINAFLNVRIGVDGDNCCTSFQVHIEYDANLSSLLGFGHSVQLLRGWRHRHQ